MKPEAGTARAVYFTGNRTVEIREECMTPVPGHTLVESRLMGISHGTEMNIYRGTISSESLSGETIGSLRENVLYPIKYGYMNTGVTESGKRVFAYYPHQDRFYCEPHDLVEIPDTISFDDTVFFASMETALGIVHDVHPHLAETGLVAGLGVIGLLVCELLIMAGVSKVYVLETSPSRIKRSVTLGCIPIDSSASPREAEILDMTSGRGADFAVNTSSSGKALEVCIDSLCMEGTLVEASWYGSRRVELPLGERFHRKRLTLKSSQVSHIGARLQAAWDTSRRRAVVLDLLKTIKPSKYITHRFSLSEASKAFACIDSSEDGLIQTVLEP